MTAIRTAISLFLFFACYLSTPVKAQTAPPIAATLTSPSTPSSSCPLQQIQAQIDADRASAILRGEAPYSWGATTDGFQFGIQSALASEPALGITFLQIAVRNTTSSEKMFDVMSAYYGTLSNKKQNFSNLMINQRNVGCEGCILFVRAHGFAEFRIENGLSVHGTVSGASYAFKMPSGATASTGAVDIALP